MMADQVADPVHLNAVTPRSATPRAPRSRTSRAEEADGWTWPWYTITSDWDVDFA